MHGTGFSLIELMVVIVILVILAAIAYPLYTSYVGKSRRSAAVTALQKAAAQEEKWYATHNTYDKLVNIGYGSNAVAIPSSNKNWYTLSASNISSTGYTLKAAPVAGGPQAGDECGTYILESTGQRKVTGSKKAGECWGSG